MVQDKLQIPFSLRLHHNIACGFVDEIHICKTQTEAVQKFDEWASEHFFTSSRKQTNILLGKETKMNKIDTHKS